VRADAEGRSLGFPVPDGRGGFDLACTSGAVGKCIRWGYRLWEEEPGGPLGERYPRLKARLGAAACTRDGALREGAWLFNWSGPVKIE
jgi:ADYC domain